jgi:GGDEF domain-containing protein
MSWQNTSSAPLHNQAFQEQVQNAFTRSKSQNRQSAIFIVAIEDYEALIDRYGQAAADKISSRTSDQIHTTRQ